jgi:ribosome-associated protein
MGKVATAVQLRFDVTNSPFLEPDVKDRLGKLAGKRLTEEGVLVIKARNHRTQEANRQEALGRFMDLVRQAAKPPKQRHKTRPTLAFQQKRLEFKIAAGW